MGSNVDRHADMATNQPFQWAVEIVAWVGWMLAANRARGTVQLRRYHLVRLATAHPGRSPYTLSVDELASWLAEQSWGAETRRARTGRPG